MARVETIVVGGGISAGTPFATNGIPYVGNSSPPLLQTTPLFFRVAGPPEAIVVSTSGADPAAGASVALRTLGGIANYEAGVNNRSYGDGHTVDTTRTGWLLMGRANTIGATTGGSSVLVGVTLSGLSAQCISFGQGNSIGLSYNASPMITLGEGIAIADGSGGTSGDIMIVGGGVTLATGNNFDSCVFATNVAISAPLRRSVLIGNSDGAGSVGGSCDSNVVIGYRFIVAASKSNSISIGASNSVQHNSVILLGGSLTSFADNQCLIGGPLFTGFINSVVIGSGDTNGTAHDTTIRLTNGTGNNNVGSALTIQAGLSTGNAASPTLSLNVGVVGGAGVTLQTSRTGVRVSHSATAADTYLMVFDVDTGTLSRVSVGAAGSGGVGFKVLRIPN